MTALEQTIQKLLVAAMKDGNKVAIAALRQAKASIQNEKVKGIAHELSEEEVICILQKIVKQLTDSEQIYRDAGRLDLAEEDLGQRKVLESLLPTQLTEEELRLHLREIVSEKGNFKDCLAAWKETYKPSAAPMQLVVKILKEEL